MSISEATNLAPYTDTLLEQCPRLRILVVGKSGAGKSALINAVFGVKVTCVSHNTPGVHDIEKELTFKGNDKLVIHDSQGFEAGEATNLQKVLNFIQCRSTESTLGGKLHGIWICAEIPATGSRIFEKGTEDLLRSVCNATKVPVIVVFTKLDILREHRSSQLEDSLETEIDDDQFEAELVVDVQDKLKTLCVQPLHALVGQKCQWIATSTQHQNTIADLVELALKASRSMENVWIDLAIAQRSQAKASIDASILIGRKHYWRGILSESLFGVGIKRLLYILMKDIVVVWNMDDPNNLLKRPEFLALISVLVEDLSDNSKEQPRGGTKSLLGEAAAGVLQNPLIVGPVVAIVAFAKWVQGNLTKTRACFQCLVGFLVDFTLTMDTLFYIHLSGGQGAIMIKDLNRALDIYGDRRGPVHASIRAMSDIMGGFDHLKADAVIDTISDIIQKYKIKPEEWNIQDEKRDENWMDVGSLRAK